MIYVFAIILLILVFFFAGKFLNSNTKS
jgi:hypothetical protein